MRRGWAGLGKGRDVYEEEKGKYLLSSHCITFSLILTITLLCKHYSSFQGGSIQVPVCLSKPRLVSEPQSLQDGQEERSWSPRPRVALRPQGSGSIQPGSRAIGKRQPRMEGSCPASCDPSPQGPHTLPASLPPCCSCISQPASCLRHLHRLLPLPAERTAGLKCPSLKVTFTDPLDSQVSTTLTTDTME